MNGAPDPACLGAAGAPRRARCGTQDQPAPRRLPPSQAVTTSIPVASLRRQAYTGRRGVSPAAPAGAASAAAAAAARSGPRVCPRESACRTFAAEAHGEPSPPLRGAVRSMRVRPLSLRAARAAGARGVAETLVPLAALFAASCAHTYAANPGHVLTALEATGGGGVALGIPATRDDGMAVYLDYSLEKRALVTWRSDAPPELIALESLELRELWARRAPEYLAGVTLLGPPGLGATRAGLIVLSSSGVWLGAGAALYGSCAGEGGGGGLDLCPPIRTMGVVSLAVGLAAAIVGAIVLSAGLQTRKLMEAKRSAPER